MSRTAPRILIHNSETDTLATRLAASVPEADIATHESYEGLSDVMAKFRPDVAYSVAFKGRQGFPRDAFLGADGPEWITVGGAGVDHLVPWDTGAVTVCNSAGVAAGMMAEYTMGMILHFTLDVPGLQADQGARHWEPQRRMVPMQGKTMLIVGLGQNGHAVAQRAKAFGCTVIGTRARPCQMDHVDEVHAPDALPALWGRADFVVIATPLVPSTRGMVDAAAFTAMKPSAILVDISRGGVVDGPACAAAMVAGQIAGAALDVFEVEPLPHDSPMWTLSNVIVSPHCSAVYTEWAMQSFELFIANLARWQAGETLNNIVSPDRGY
ncbi:D-2-hydroxyacid dehydrogenase [Roseovarius sp. LXJ103]|uniref:D-2-hydroxyacid dehydrogenase n=1 Tax=Roseovarius carneus TaxID=2853164 RepID=UPI000D607112|nr:D-2-hydroxyacid dehydrogenase [Roseovarius carneus]MBZ8117951.1 D-2-hydroxyacid dehydrogenase [Roseovarius carneus]PWE36295.1 D-2-hydroxyacid dehydrogenase [Pelagicola sp. LXJ1103]